MKNFKLIQTKTKNKPVHPFKKHRYFSAAAAVAVAIAVTPRPARLCLADVDCNKINSCLDSRCQNPCFASNPCPPSAICKPFEQQPHCHCPNGTRGNPWKQCEPGLCPRLSSYCTRIGGNGASLEWHMICFEHDLLFGLLLGFGCRFI